MRAMLALVKREYLEHRGPFVLAPVVILAILAIILAGSLITRRVHFDYEVQVPSAVAFFEFGFFSVFGLWFVYLLAALFFYFADAFNADRRNNSMLFWKSMPVTDFTVLSSKLLAGVTVFPALIYGAALLTGLLVLVTALAAPWFVPNLMLPTPLEFLASAWGVASFAAVYLALALLWYAPFFAWVGALSTLVGRWSIPLAFLIPGLVGLTEQFLIGRTSPGMVLTYLRERVKFYVPHGFEDVFVRRRLADGTLVAELLASIDWPQLGLGLIVAALLVYAASEYRRRIIAV